MKVYVDEFPRDCIECPFCQDIKVNAGMDRLLFCKANKGKAIKNIEKSFDKCIVKNEFHSLADYTKQVKKEVCDNFRKTAMQYYKECDNGILMLSVTDVWEILDQIQGE